MSSPGRSEVMSPNGAPYVVLRPITSDVPTLPGSGVVRRWPGPRSRSPEAVPSTTTSLMPSRGIVSSATGLPSMTGLPL